MKSPFFTGKRPGGISSDMLPGFQFVLLLRDISSQCGKEFIEMAVYRSIAIGMTDIDGLSETGGLDRYPGDIAIGRGEYGQVLLSLGPDIQSHVIVIGTELSEISRQAHRYVQWIPEIILRIICQEERPAKKKGRNKGNRLASK